MEIRNRELSPEEFRRMQLVELGMLAEFDRVCNENGINYVIFSGSLLGAVRHKGYIPWDDDADVALLREDYEKFKKVADQLNGDICYFQDHSTDPDYRWGYGKLRRTGTTYVRIGQEHLKCKTGIFIDIFPLDDVPKSLAGQMFQDFYCFCCRKILWSEVGKKAYKGIKGRWFSLLSKIPTDTVFKWLDLYIKRSRNARDNKVRILCFTSIGKLYYKHKLKDRYGMPKEWFTERERYSFENTLLWGSKDYDTVLTYFFNDYMTPPPVDKRACHSPFSIIDFGDSNIETV